MQESERQRERESKNQHRTYIICSMIFNLIASYFVRVPIFGFCAAMLTIRRCVSSSFPHRNVSHFPNKILTYNNMLTLLFGMALHAICNIFFSPSSRSLSFARFSPPFVPRPRNLPRLCKTTTEPLYDNDTTVIFK